MPIGTRYRNNISKSSQLNNTRRSMLELNTDKGGFVIKANDIAFAATNTITSDSDGFPAFSGDNQINGDFANYVTNGTFGADTDWTKGSGWAIGTGVATATTSDEALSQEIVGLVPGRTYTVTFTATRSAGSVAVSVGGTAGTSRSSSATFTEAIVCGSTGVLAFTGTGFSGTIDNVILTAWEFGAGWANSVGEATATTSNASVSQTLALDLVEGAPYVVKFTTTRSAGSVVAVLGGTSGTSRSTAATFEEVILAGSTNVLAFTGTGFSGTIDDVTVSRASLSAGQLIEVSGSALNSRTYEIVSVTPTTITVNPAQIQTEASGVNIDIRTV